ncbi:MAG: LamG domain-containing protein, partial [Candidatus Daviesbacteria bacterium]|nr:LamG domain-containing protein [Candidatus Daviesbacteria bacterium]
GSYVAYWKMDVGQGTTAQDSSENNNDLTLSSASWTDSGKFGKAWNGTNALWLSRADDADLDFGATEDLAISLWYKSDSATNPSAIEYLVNKASATVAGYAIYANTDGTVCFGIDDDTTWSPDVASCTTTDVYDATWHHIAAVRNTTLDTTYIYIDGLSRDSDTDSTSATLENSEIFYIGDRDGTDNGDEFAGDIDEVKVYRLSLTVTEVGIDLNQGTSLVLGALSSGIVQPTSFNGLKVWYLANAQDSSDDSTLGSLFDSSGNNYTTTQGTAANKPTFKTNIINSLPIVRFDGTNDSFNATSYSAFMNTSNFSFFAVAKTNVSNDGGNHTILGRNHSASGGAWDFGIATNGKVNISTWNGSGTQTQVKGATALGTSSFYIISATDDGTTRTIYLNGTQDNSGTGTTINDTISTPVTVGVAHGGSAELWNGDIAEVILYNRSLSSTERQTIETYLSNKYNISVSTLTSPVRSSAVQEYCIPGDTSAICSAPVGRWDFEEKTGTTTQDISGNGITGTLTSGPTYTTGKQGAGINFDGSDDHVLIADNATLDFAAGASFTLEGWFRHTTQSSGQDFMISKFASTGYKLYMEADGDMSCGIDDDGTSFPEDSVTSTAETYDDNAWHHVACVKSATTSLTLYIDGKSVGTADTSISATGTLANADPFYIGIDQDGTSNAWLGQLDSIKVFNHARTAAQVAWDYNRGAPIGWWKLDECQGTTAGDSSGKANPGTITIGASGEDTVGTCSTSSTAWGSGLTGKRNYSLSFDGTDDYVSVADNDVFTASTTNGLTVSAWINPANVTGTKRPVSKGTVSNYEWEIRLNGAGPEAYLFAASGANYLSAISSTTISASQWSYITFTVDLNTTTLKIYVNGVETGSDTTASGSYANGTSAVRFGMRVDASSPYAGTIDDVKIFNYPLTLTQVKEIYTGGATFFGPVTGAP